VRIFRERGDETLGADEGGDAWEIIVEEVGDGAGIFF